MKVNYKLLAVASSVLSAAAGSAAGYFYAKKKFEAQYEGIIAAEVAGLKEYYAQLYKKDDYATPGEVLARRVPGANLDPSVANDGITVDGDIPQPEVLGRVVEGLRYAPGQRPPSSNIFAKLAAEPKVDPGKEIPSPVGKLKLGKGPRIISAQEYMENELPYAQATYTYYEGDLTLADEDDMTVDDIDRIIGTKHLSTFGVESGDPNVVYIRNDRISMDFEVVRHPGKYSELVMGDVEGDPQPSPRKFRNRREE